MSYLIPIVGLVSAIIGGLLVAWANWGIEKRKQKLLYKIELIRVWRALLADAAAYQKASNLPDEEVNRYIERHRDYYSLQPHVRVDAETALALMTGKTEAEDSTLSPLLHHIMRTIARKEEEWDLV